MQIREKKLGKEKTFYHIDGKLMEKQNKKKES